MEKDQTVGCPLCQGNGQVRRSRLSHALSDRVLREKLEAYVAELLGEASGPAEVGANGSRDFQKEVHSWNPELPIWRRSPKE